MRLESGLFLLRQAWGCVEARRGKFVGVCRGSVWVVFAGFVGVLLGL
jgi:hypothetical protein